MQNPSSSVSSGNMSPAIVGSDKAAKEIYVVGGMVLILTVAIGAVWFYSGQSQSYVSKTPSETLSSAQDQHDPARRADRIQSDHPCRQ